MMKQLWDVLRYKDPDRELVARLSRMMTLAEELLVEAGARLFEGPSMQSDRDAFYNRDQEINRLQQAIRKSLVGRLELSTATERARFLLITGLLKDVERLGDYAKNLLEAAEMLRYPLPAIEQVPALRQIRSEVEASMTSAKQALLNSDEQSAQVLIQQGQAVSQRCEQVVAELARSELPAHSAVPLALAARHYKRIQKHIVNALTTLTMPLHKVDYVS